MNTGKAAYLAMKISRVFMFIRLTQTKGISVRIFTNQFHDHSARESWNSVSADRGFIEGGMKTPKNFIQTHASSPDWVRFKGFSGVVNYILRAIFWTSLGVWVSRVWVSSGVWVSGVWVSSGVIESVLFDEYFILLNPHVLSPLLLLFKI